VAIGYRVKERLINWSRHLGSGAVIGHCFGEPCLDWPAAGEVCCDWMLDGVSY